jgi:predicted small secreted protein
MRRVLVLAALAVPLAGCATMRGYDGPARAGRDVALIVGSPPVSAGLPLAAVLRKVDERVVVLGYSKVEVAPGEHHVLVDCVMASTHTTTRHELKFETYSGRRYVLVPESAPGNAACGSVRVDER